MKVNRIIGTLSFVLLFTSGLLAQSTWPRNIPNNAGATITMYQPQLESLNGNILSGRAALSVKMNATTDPVFGAVWMDASMETDRTSRMMELQSVTVKQIKFGDNADTTKLQQLKNLIQTELPKWNLTISQDQVLATLENKTSHSSSGLNTNAPNIIYRNVTSLLVLIDGDPKVQMDNNLKMQRVINTAFPIVMDGSTYYLNVGSLWYSSSSVTSGWTYQKKLPSSIKKLNDQIKKQAAQSNPQDTAGMNADPSNPPLIVVATTPTELLQSNGDADYKTLEGTNLLFVSNSPNDIFKDINSQNTFVLLSGRWYSAPGLSGPWTYVPSDSLPADFARIKEGGDKDNVLSSVAGTNAAEEAKMDAMIPQTAKVDRSTATTTVTYDGTPQFEKISGTSLELAVNTSSTVLKSGSKYYVVDNGIWYVGNSASGPWSVSDTRPTDVANIPASSPAYSVKYVDIYEATPTYVIVGYTPGYMNSFIYGPTVVYGTGWYYNPWYGPYYYPRPCTFGFGMSYNPWTGWGFSWGVSWGMGPWSFGVGTGGMYFGFHCGGYFGPPMYRPPYYGGYGNHYGNNNINIHNNINVNVNSNNIYNKRQGVQSRNFGGNSAGNLTPSRINNNPIKPGGNDMPGKNGGGLGPSNTRNNVFADKSGNVFQRDNNGNWNQNVGGNWKSASSGMGNNLNNMQADRDRSMSRDNMMQSRMGGGGFGGGGRFGGGGGGGGRMGGRF